MSRPPGIDEAPAEALSALRFPLHGSRLIEASAGTGKTYTIAALYVRLVLGHGRGDDGGNDDGYARALSPPEILVVTFTEAATQELRERIRRRLAEAAACFLSDAADESASADGDPLLRELRAGYPRAAWGGCARRLQVAAEWMDEAAVSTIHGWCNRMLREHAFDSDSLFTQTLEADQSELFGEVVRDYWRTFMAPLDTPAVVDVLPWWPGPDALQGDLRRLVDHAELLAEPAEPVEPALLLRAARAQRLQRLAELKAPWAAWADELEGLLDAAVAAKCVNGRKLQARFYRPWLDALRRWAADPQASQLELNSGWTRLTPAGLREVWTRGEAPRHPALDAIGALARQLGALPEARSELLGHAARWVARRFAQEQARHARIGFNDLLTRLDAALRGSNGARLAQRMRQQFPVALIDEFQDTDPVQYRIFDAVYRVEQNDPSTALILIGDPKQAIYAFRGADIHTYLAARRACAGRLYTLTTNFRSSVQMVAASNRCFAAAEQRAAGDGAFLFRAPDGNNPLPFVAADAKGRRDAWRVDGVAPAALTVCCLMPGDDPAPLAKDAYRAQMAQVCASQMVRLLNLAQAGRAGFAPGNALRPADMAVLVSNRREAQAIRGALAERGVRSVYLSDQDSVFACAQAAELQHWLAACAEPDDARLLRAALATTTLGLSYARLDALNHDELAWEARVLQFRDYRECWRRQGVLPMLRRLLNDFGVPARLLGASAENRQSGERLLTDLLHLAELMQQASVRVDGEHALIRHLAEQRHEAAQGASGDARQIRLESDADLVQVVTVHKSKGLEYPLVFLPFACSTRHTRADDLPLKYHDDGGAMHLALCASDEVLALADRERLGEDLRKLYVALTRACYATWVGVGALAALERSAFGYLVGGGEPLAPATLAAALEEWRGGCPEISIVAAPEPDRQRLAAAAAPIRLGAARSMGRAVGEHWWVASYSALRTVAVPRPTAPVADALAETAADSASEDQFNESRAVSEPPDAGSNPAPAGGVTAGGAAPSTSGALHGLPRGADVGSFLHGMLEAAASGGFARLAGDPQRLRELVDRRCQSGDWARWSETLCAWLGGFLLAPLTLAQAGGVAAASFSLAGLASAQAEMEFWLAAQRVDSQALDRLVCAHTLAGAPRPALQPGQLNGMLKGYIDLVFEHQGRYFVVDYKSNWLGPDDAAYTPDALREAIAQARYDLQYVLYLFALHRLLKSRLPDYDYDRHVGGAVYIFLRGLAAPGQGLHAERPPRALIEALDRLFTGKGADETATERP